MAIRLPASIIAWMTGGASAGAVAVPSGLTVATIPGPRSSGGGAGGGGGGWFFGSAPPEVVKIIEAGNRIATRPYVYGGGHGKWEDRGYDCSGSVSYALHGANLLKAPLPSGSFTSWGQSGPGEWVTIYANGGHMYMVVAGLRFDTSGRSGDHASRWQLAPRSAAGFAVRHYPGL